MKKLLIALSLMLLSALVIAKGQYMSNQDFLKKAFGSTEVEAKALWLKEPLKQTVNSILKSPFKGVRLRYWQQGKRTAWILNDIGKELPITIGVVVEDNAVVFIDILEFRESRGWEVRFPYFTEQFEQIALNDQGSLNKTIDGVTGATLSVETVKRCTKLALILTEAINAAP